MIYEERCYTIKPGKLDEYIDNFGARALPVQGPILGNLVGFFRTDFGRLNQVVHIWGYDDLDDRLRKRASVWHHPDWPEYIKRARPLLQAQENRLLYPVPFSPLK